MKIKFLFFCLLASTSSIAQIINTIAGTGSATYSGDNGPAVSACIYSPSGLCFDALGNLFFADEGNNCIRKIDTSGIITTIAGTGIMGSSGNGGLATAAQIGYPTDVTFDKKGNLYIVVRPDNTIRKVNLLGIISTVAGIGLAGYNGDTMLATSAKLYDPAGIAADNIGNIYIADQSNHRVRKVDTSGIITTFAGTGVSGYSGDGGLSIYATLNRPYGLVFDATGNLYVADIGNNTIRKIDLSGAINTIAGDGTPGYSGDGGQANFAQLNFPYKITFDLFGNLYIADKNNQRVRVVYTSGIINTVVGNGTNAFSGDGGLATGASLYNPQGVIIDNFANLYISDGENHRIRKVTSPNYIQSNKTVLNSIRSFPNPSNNNIIISSSSELGTITIYNSLGEAVLQTKSKNTQEQIDISKLPNGIYFISAQGSHVRFVKE